jgi:hypothetical protein
MLWPIPAKSGSSHISNLPLNASYPVDGFILFVGRSYFSSHRNWCRDSCVVYRRQPSCLRDITEFRCILIASMFFLLSLQRGFVWCVLGHVFGVENFLPLAKRCVYLAIITILSGFLVIAWKLKILSAWRYTTLFRPTSFQYLVDGTL